MIVCDKLTGAINLVWLDRPDSAGWQVSSESQTCSAAFQHVFGVVLCIYLCIICFT